LTVIQERNPPLVRAGGAITTERLRVIPPMNPFYTKTPRCLITIFDLRHLGAEERLEREHAAWHGYSDIEPLTADLIVHPGGAA
jgi:hypothetical protein